MLRKAALRCSEAAILSLLAPQERTQVLRGCSQLAMLHKAACMCSKAVIVTMLHKAALMRSKAAIVAKAARLNTLVHKATVVH